MKSHGILEDEWIMSYASGALSEAHALVVASHCDFHPELKAKIHDAENIGGALMESANPSILADDAFDTLWKKIDSGETIEEVINSNDNELNMPRPLADYLGKPFEELDWRTMGPGLSQVRLWTGPNDERLWLLRAKGGAKIPSHDHNGLEMTLVLTGSYHVGDKQYTPGLLELADNDVENHQPIIDPGQECICLVVTEAPIKIHSLLGRLAQPFIGL